MKKVILIHNGYLSARNGANTVMRSLLESKDLFAKQGIEIKSLTPDNFVQRSFEPNSPDESRNLRRAKARKWLKALTQYSRLASDVMLYLTDIRPAKRIVSYYINSKPDSDETVFFHSIIPCYYYLKLRKSVQKTIVVCHSNGDNFKMDRLYYRSLEKSFVYKRMLKMEQYVIKNADRINFVAKMAMMRFLELHPEVNEKKVSFIYNGIPDIVKQECSREEKKYMEICCVASVSNRKGQHFIIEALKQIPKNNLPKVHFTFVGDGSDRLSLEKLTNESGLSDYATFVGVSYDVDKYLFNSDAYILPSEDEGLPMAIIEAMRASLPIISTRVGGIPEMIKHGKNGLLINPCVDDVRFLLIHLEDYDWKAMGDNARITYLNKFSIDKMIEAYGHLLKS